MFVGKVTGKGKIVSVHVMAAYEGAQAQLLTSLT